MPRPSPEARAVFESLLPDDPAVICRPMFGNQAAFVNGNMFAGLFGEELFVRLGEAERDSVIELGGGDFAPMPGRAMKDYVTLPSGWAGQLEPARDWIARSLEWTRALPAKQPKPSRGGRRR